MKKTYPAIESDHPRYLAEALREIGQMRKQDLKDFDNLVNRFVTGRKVARTPSASNDVLATDRENDFNWTASFLYILVNNGGTLAWRRVALAAW